MCLLVLIKKTVLGTAMLLLELESFVNRHDVLDGIYRHLHDAYTGLTCANAKKFGNALALDLVVGM